MPSTQREVMTPVPEVAENVTPVLAPDYKSMYINFVQAGYTPFDIGLLVGESAGYTVDGGKHFVEFKAKLVMTPLEAKVLAKIIGRTLEAYEKQFGVIEVPAVAWPKDEEQSEGV